MVALMIVSIVFIICFTVLMALYIIGCSDNKVKMFEPPKYNERISKLEKEMEELKRKL